jgi:hypothetical protein
VVVVSGRLENGRSGYIVAAVPIVRDERTLKAVDADERGQP